MRCLLDPERRNMIRRDIVTHRGITPAYCIFTSPKPIREMLMRQYGSGSRTNPPSSFSLAERHNRYRASFADCRIGVF